MPEENQNSSIPPTTNPSVLDKPVPNPLAKNPNVNTHKVFASIGLVLIGVIIIIAGVWYYVDGRFSTAETNDSTAKVTTSSAKPKTSTTSSDLSSKKDETKDWKTYIREDFGFSLKHPESWYEDPYSDPNPVITNYDTSKDEARGYVPNLDKGKIKISISRNSKQDKSLEKQVSEYLNSPTYDNQTKTNSSSISTKVDGENAIKIEYKIDLGVYGAVYIEKGNFFYVVTSFNDYESNEKIFDQIVSTFKFL